MPSIDPKTIAELRALAERSTSDSMRIGAATDAQTEPGLAAALGDARNALRALPVLLEERDELLSGAHRSMDEAARVAREAGYGAGHTGLRKVCPRCGRGGWIFRAQPLDALVIVWDGPARGPSRMAAAAGQPWPAREADLESLGHASSLFDPVFGCGYD